MENKSFDELKEEINKFDEGAESMKILDDKNVINFNVFGERDSNKMEKALIGALQKIKLPQIPDLMKVFGKVDVDFPEKQKVEVTNHKEVQKVEVINTIAPVEVQKVTVENQVEFPETQKVEVTNPIKKFIVENLPIGKGKKVNKVEANPSQFLIVRLSDGQKFIDNLGSTVSSDSKQVMEKVWLREEYTYDGENNPTRVEKWDGQFKLTLDYEYDGNNNAIVMSRSLEPNSVIGS